MKKSVAIIILAISSLSIIIVGLLFQKSEIYEPNVYVSEVIVTGVRVDDGDALKTYLNPEKNIYYIEDPLVEGKTLHLTYVEGLKVEILYKVLPADATKQTVSFYSSQEEIATVDQDKGVVEFIDFGTVTFRLVANDTSKAEASIRIRAKRAD